MQEQPTESDETLVLKARQGDREAFTKLVIRYFGTVWSIAYARLGRNDSADDLAQEVFLVAFLHLQSLSDAARFGGWLSQITHHRAIDWARQKQRYSKLVALVPLENLHLVGAAEEESPMERDEQDQAVRKALFALPPEQREMILLKFAEGLTQKEIAERLDVHPGTIGRNMDIALGLLKKSLGALMDDSIARLRPARGAAMKTTALVGAVVMTSAAQRASLLAASGTVPKSAGAATAKIFATGAGTLSTFKAAAVVIGIVLMGGIGAILYEQSSPGSAQPAMASAPSSSAPAASQASAPATLPSALEQVLAAQKECFPTSVLAAATIGSKTLTASFPANLEVSAQAHAIDHLGVHWFGLYYQRVGDGTGRIPLGDFNRAKIMGVVTEEGEALPVQFTSGRWPNTQRVWVKYDQPWPRGEVRYFGLMATYDSVKPDANGIIKMRFDNTPGPDSVQQFIFVANKSYAFQSSTEPPISTVVEMDYTIYFWQKHVHKNKGYRVDLELKQLDQPH